MTDPHSITQSTQIRRFKKLIPLTLASTLVLTGCFNKEEPKPKSKPQQVTYQDQSLTIQALKSKYADKNNSYVMPLYNVKPDQEFTFHFNSYVGDQDLNNVISVHTDSKVQEDSKLDIELSPESYEVAPSTIHLNPTKGTINNKQAQWGASNTYYIRIDYDLDSQEPTKLKKPIIIPFTIKAPINAPKLSYTINSNGDLQLTWNKVKGATSYKIYNIPKPQTEGNVQRAESSDEDGYQNAFPNNIATLSSKKTNFKDWLGKRKTYIYNTNGELSKQNIGAIGDYIITAIDKHHKESQASNVISIQQIANQIPYYLQKAPSDNLHETIRSLPKVAKVQMMDGSTSYMPIKYDTHHSKIDGNADGYTDIKYSIPNSRYKGTVQVIRASKQDLATLEAENNQSVVASNHQVQNLTPLAPPVTAPTIKKALIHEVLKAEGTVRNTGNTEAKGNTKGNGNTGSTNTTQPQGDSGSNALNGVSSSVKGSSSSNGVASSAGVLDAKEATKELTSLKEQGIVSQQRYITKTEVDWADQELVTKPSYLQQYNVHIFANSAVEEYLALQLLQAPSEISVKAFPQVQDYNTLTDIMNSVLTQNPLIQSVKAWKYNYNTQSISMTYDIPQSDIQSNIITMLDKANQITQPMQGTKFKDTPSLAKAQAIFTYLANNAKWGTSLDDTTSVNGTTNKTANKAKPKPPTYNPITETAYSVLINGVGTDKGYAQAFDLLADMLNVQSITVTGKQDGLARQWNKINFNNRWYNVDTVSNQLNTGIPYMLLNADDTLTRSVDLVETDDYLPDLLLSKVRGNGDYTKELYKRNGLEISDLQTYRTIVTQAIQQNKELYVRLDPTLDIKAIYDITTSVVQQTDKSKLATSKIIIRGNYVYFTTNYQPDKTEKNTKQLNSSKSN